jgi:diketogulonate reductase-like aldo/keto reductase
MPIAKLRCGERVPALGQGTWTMGEDRRRRKEEIAALRLGIDLGMKLIDTAEMYGNGGAEEVVAEAIAGRREEIFLVSKVLPEHATRRGIVQACERSLKRLATDRIDLYLLHWREDDVELVELIEAFTALARAGKIRHWGVSNFDVADMEELAGLRGGKAVAADQVMYNLARRGIEHDLLAWCRRRRIAIMAYSPLDEGRLARSRKLAGIARKLDTTPAQLALAWLLHQANVVAIPKSADAAHVRQNFAALDLRLGAKELAALDRAFPPPRRKLALATT